MENVLIVDDYPGTCKGYQMFMEDAVEQNILPKLHFDWAHSCKVAYEKIKDISDKGQHYRFVILDIRLPAFPEAKIFSGEDLGILLRKLKMASKILVITGISEKFRLANMLNNFNPEALVLKTELDDNLLVKIIQKILNNQIYYSDYILKMLNSRFCVEKKVDSLDQQILYYLSEGQSTKEIATHLGLSESGIEKRKKQMKETFSVTEKGVFPLIRAGKSNGLI